MEILLFDSLTREKREFKPIDDKKVRIASIKITMTWNLPFSICLTEIESINIPPMMYKQTCQRVQHHGM